MVDLFNSTSNNYVTPNFKPCAGSDGDKLEFLDNGQVGIINGSNILSFIDFSGISISVEGYNHEIKVLQSGEVAYVNGLTKGLLNRQQGFLIPDLSSNNAALDTYFMTLDFSINYYKNFKYYNINLEASANYVLNTSITNVTNALFSANSINVNLNYDPCVFTFIGSVEGYDFDITNTILSLVDASQNSLSPFTTLIDQSTGIRVPRKYNLVDASAYDIPYARYPNGAMQGILMKVIYPLPSSVVLDEWNKWIYMNHIQNEVTVWELDGSCWTPTIKTVDAGLSGASTSTTMSAGDYLDYVTTNNYWDKIGYFYLKASAPDNPNDDTLSNLMNGFYLYNPQTYPVKVEYMVFV